MFDMPVDIASAVGQIDIGTVAERVADLTPVIEVVKHTWDTQTIEQLARGEVTIPDDVINDSLSSAIEGNERVRSVKITSLGDSRFRLEADTTDIGRVNFLCRMDEFVHNRDTSRIKFRVMEKELKDHGTLSWIFSRISLSMAEKMVGKIELGDNIQTNISGNNVTVDFDKALQQSSLGTTELFGMKLSDAVVIRQAVPKNGYVEVQTGLDVPDETKEMLLRMLK